MPESYNLYKRFRDSIIFKPVVYGLLVLAGIVLVDQLIMPLYVKLGREIEMPDVLELSLPEAQTRLAEYGFRIVVSDSLYDSKHPQGTVIEQNPYPFAMVKKDRRVYLTVSIGEKPIVMPNLFGVSPREAELILQAHNLKLNGKSYVFSDIYHEGTVMGQSYPQGQAIRSGAAIDITISLGKLNQEKMVPNLNGKSLSETREILKAMGLKIGRIEYEKRQEILPETVLKQSRPEGSIFNQGDSIDLTVSEEM
jgi:eukaryotic-like serine/threonine-protein kinase